MQAAALRLARSEVVDLPILSHWPKLLAYLTAALAHEQVEQARVLYLDGAQPAAGG